MPVRQLIGTWTTCYRARYQPGCSKEEEGIRRRWRSIKKEGEALRKSTVESPMRRRREASASIYTQAARFNEASPGRSPEPKRRAIRASTRFNTVD
ncbi:hypothetical protein BHM03_00017321 [Ensete ventricosum]|nr:hypothetical protein BHM03_00017321 [Ensete ventricosum]